MDKSIEISGIEGLSMRIGEQLSSDHFDFILLRIPPRGEQTHSESMPAEANMIHDLIMHTGCPVLSVSNFPIRRKFSRFLQPIDPCNNDVECYRRIIPLIRLFNSTLHLLLVVDGMDRDAYHHGASMLKLSGDFFRESHVKVKSRIIRHSNRINTILAYADIIRAGLIGNTTEVANISGRKMNDPAWLNLVDRSEIPLYNYHF